jgi:nucleoid DNA-binding protein
LIERVVTDTNQPKTVVEAIVRGALAQIEGAIGKGETVNLVGFGRFEVYERGARRGRNLRTGEISRFRPPSRCASKSASACGMSLPDRNASGPGKVRSSCRLRQLDARNDRIPRRALVNVLLLAKGA